MIVVRAKPPAEEQAILALSEQCAKCIERFDPEQVIIFASDHYAGFHLANMPAYCIGLSAHAEDDVGGFGGKLAVPTEQAHDLTVHMRNRGFDPSISYDMTVDHAFSQPLKKLTGSLCRYPVIPIFIGSMVPPFIEFGRSHAFGSAVGDFITSTGMRTLIMASGGLSHHPTRYYPLIGEGAPEIAAWQMHAERGKTFTREEWFEKLAEDHLAGAQMLVSGVRTEKDIRLNPQFDQSFMEHFVAGDVEALRTMSVSDALEQAGIGSLELHTWIAALAAHLRTGGALPTERIYAPTLEYGIGYGMAYSPLK